MGPNKEMHTFIQPERGSMISALFHIPWEKYSGREWLHREIIKDRFRVNHTRYFDYFAKIMDENGAGASGDLSPSNQHLSIELLRNIKREFESRGIKVVPVFLMRDPVDRLHSLVRYRKRMRAHKKFLAPETEAESVRFLTRLHFDSASHAPATLYALNTVFPGQAVTMMYETMFDQTRINSLMDQIGLPHKLADFQPVNATEKEESLSEDIALTAALTYAGTYRAANNLFGFDTVQAHWPYAALANEKS